MLLRYHKACTIAAKTLRLQSDLLKPQRTGHTGAGALDARGGAARELTCLRAHPARPTVCATGGSDGTVAVWDLRFQQQPLLLAGGAPAAFLLCCVPALLLVACGWGGWERRRFRKTEVALVSLAGGALRYSMYYLPRFCMQRVSIVFPCH